MLTQEQALECYRKTGAILKGHFKLTSGRHSDTYMQSAKLFVQPAQAEKVCAALAEKLSGQKNVHIHYKMFPHADHDFNNHLRDLNQCIMEYVHDVMAKKQKKGSKSKALKKIKPKE